MMNAMMQEPQRDPRMMAKVSNAANPEPSAEGDEAMQTIAVVRRMAEQDPNFLGELRRMVEEIGSDHSADMPRRGYAAP